MKAVVLTGIRKMEMREVPDPKIEQKTDVLLKMGAIGVCGSDVHYYLWGRIGSQVVRYPFTVGHECAGVVEKVGSAVFRVKPGDRVAVEPAMSCGACDQCLANRPHTCRKLKFLGCPGQAEGCLSEYIVMSEKCCYPIGDNITLEQAAFCEPLSIGIYAVRLSVAMKDAATSPQSYAQHCWRVGILGVGPIGLSVLLAARHSGIRKIYVTDKIPQRLAVAGSVGATWTGNSDTQDVVGDIEKVEPLLLDAVFECCGQQEALDQAVELLKPGGKLMIVGVPETDRISFSIDKLRRKEICLQNVRRQNYCVQPALDLIEDGLINVDFMVTHRFTLEQTKEAFDLVADLRDGVVKAMIEM